MIPHVIIGILIGLAIFLLFCIGLSYSRWLDCDMEEELTEEELLFVYGDEE